MEKFLLPVLCLAVADSLSDIHTPSRRKHSFPIVRSAPQHAAIAASGFSSDQRDSLAGGSIPRSEVHHGEIASFDLAGSLLQTGSVARSGPLQPPQALQVTLAVAIQWFHEANIPFTVVFGTALQIFRDGSLKKHDDDVDILVQADDRQRIDALLAKHGYYKSFDGKTMNQVHWMPDGNGSVLIPNGSQLDMYADTGGADYVCVPWNKCAYPRSYFEPGVATTVTLNGKTFNITLPGQTEKFLAATYGKSWNVPQDKKGDASVARAYFYKKCPEGKDDYWRWLFTEGALHETSEFLRDSSNRRVCAGAFFVIVMVAGIFLHLRGFLRKPAPKASEAPSEAPTEAAKASEAPQ